MNVHMACINKYIRATVKSFQLTGVFILDLDHIMLFTIFIKMITNQIKWLGLNINLSSKNVNNFKRVSHPYSGNFNTNTMVTETWSRIRALTFVNPILPIKLAQKMTRCWRETLSCLNTAANLYNLGLRVKCQKVMFEILIIYFTL